VEHLQHFGLSQDPFSNEPDLRFYFESVSHRDAQRRVERGLRQRKGLTLLTAEGGMGKTLLARRILDVLEEEIFEATLLVMLPGAADATGILQRFARQLGTEEPANDRPGLLGQIYEQLAIVREDGRHAVLMVDDAQIMSPEVFAELGGLLNLEYEDRRLMSILFVGTPDLDRLIENDPSMSPRVDVRVRMQPLDMPDTTAYIEHRLAAVNGNTKLVPAAVIETLYKFGRGRPRLLNTLADNALFEAYLAGRAVIDPGDVERAASDLGIGPDPGATFSPASMRTSVPEPAAVESAPAAPIVELHDPTPATPMAEPDAPSIDSIAEFELTPEMASAADLPSAALDIDAGLEAALEDFGNDTSGSASLPDLDLSSDALQFDLEPSAPSAEAISAAPRLIEVEPELELQLEPEPASEPELILADAELAPLEAGDTDEFDDIFVELIEE
jgi:general secretion pathway protein A